MTRPQPVHGTPIHGIEDVAAMALRADAAAGSGAGLGGGFGGRSDSHGNQTFDLPFQTNIQCFKICSCWRTEEKNVYGGDATGCYWVCDAVPIVHWKNWNWSGTGPIPPPETFWEPEQLAADDLKTRIWWVNHDSSCCCDPCATSSDDCPQPEGVSPAEFPPKFGLSQWVWCIYDYDSGEWRLLDGFEDIVRVRLNENWHLCGCASLTVLVADCHTTCDVYPGESGCETSDCEHNCKQCTDACDVTLHDGPEITGTDPLGVIASSLLAVESDGYDLFIPAGMTAIVKRNGDSNAWEPLTFGEPCKQSESGSGSEEEDSSSEEGSSSEEPSTSSEVPSTSSIPCTPVPEAVQALPEVDYTRPFSIPVFQDGCWKLAVIGCNGSSSGGS